jgi:hypothetical protein
MARNRDGTDTTLRDTRPQAGQESSGPLAAPPRFADLETERTFWDEHDTGEMSGFGSVPDQGSPAEGLAHVLSVRFDRATFRALAAAAQRVGVGPSTLLRMWAIDRLRPAAGAPPAGQSAPR